MTIRRVIAPVIAGAAAAVVMLRTTRAQWAAMPASSPAVAGVLAIAATAAGTALGAWWLPFAAGTALGAWAHASGRWRALGAIAAVAALGWALPLAWMAVRGQDVGGVAATTSALTGLPRSAAVGLAAALAVCCLQSIAGAALGRTVANALTSAS